VDIKKIYIPNSKSAKISEINHTNIGVIEIPNPKYIGKIKKALFSTP